MNQRLALALSATTASHPFTDDDRKTADRLAVKAKVTPMTDAEWSEIRASLTGKLDTSAWSAPMVHAAARVSAARMRRIGAFV
jgi:hypothetical protein